MLVFAFQSEIWIAQNLNFTVFKDFCLSSSWKYRFWQNVNHTKVQSKTNKYCKFHFDLTRRRLPKSPLKKLGMVPKKLYRNTLKREFWSFCFCSVDDFTVEAEDVGRIRGVEIRCDESGWNLQKVRRAKLSNLASYRRSYHPSKLV